MEKVKKYNIPIRICPNLQILQPNAKNGVIGNWVRPEDIDVYEEYIDTFELWGESNFVKASIKIYKEEGKWDGDLMFLIPDLGYNIDNRTLNKDITKGRVNCGQRCLEGSTCRICHLLPSYSATIKQAAALIKD